MNNNHEKRTDLYNKALMGLYSAYPNGPHDGSPEEAEHIDKLAKNVGYCTSCGNELMTVDDSVKHHDGRFGYDMGNPDDSYEQHFDHPAK
jgi:hypothetical protein